MVEIERMTYDFDEKKRNIEVMEGLSLADFTMAFDRVFVEECKKFEVHVLSRDRKEVSQGKTQERVKSGEVTWVDGAARFICRARLYPDFWSGAI